MGTRSDLVVYLATTSYDGPAGTDRHIADQLSRNYPVLFVNPPVSVVAKLRGSNAPTGAPLRVQSPTFAQITPWVTPGITRPGLHHLVAPMIRRATRSAVAQLYPGSAATEPLAAIITCRIEGPWDVLPARRLLFYGTDDLIAGADLLHLPVERLIRYEQRTLRDADAVAVVSAPLAQRYAGDGYEATVIPNGCEPDAYAYVDSAPLPDDVRLPGPVAGLIGQINERIDLALLEAVADAGVDLLIVGPAAPGYQPERFAALTARPNVHWVGPKPFEELPRYLRLIDVGLTPYADSAFNRASFPLKTLEYLAAGRAAVSTPLPANDWLNSELIEVADGPAAYAAAVGAALARPRTPEIVAHRRAFAAAHSWANRARALAELAGLPAGGRHARPEVPAR